MLVTLLGVNSHNRIEIYNEITNFSCMKSITVIEYCLFVRRRHVGMADDADSKSVGRKPVWVQVPLPALFAKPRKSKIFSKIKGLRGFFFTYNLSKIKEIRVLLRKICPKKVPKKVPKNLPYRL